MSTPDTPQHPVSPAASAGRITIDPAICHGQPVVRGLRYPVATLLELLSAGQTVDELLADFPDLQREDFAAVLAYAARTVQVGRVETFAA